MAWDPDVLSDDHLVVSTLMVSYVSVSDLMSHVCHLDVDGSSPML